MLFCGGLVVHSQKATAAPSLLPACPPQPTASCLPSHARLQQAPVAFEVQGGHRDGGRKQETPGKLTESLGNPWGHSCTWFSHGAVKAMGRGPREAPAARRGDAFPCVRFLEHSSSS